MRCVIVLLFLVSFHSSHGQNDKKKNNEIDCRDLINSYHQREKENVSEILRLTDKVNQLEAQLYRQKINTLVNSPNSSSNQNNLSSYQDDLQNQAKSTQFKEYTNLLGKNDDFRKAKEWVKHRLGEDHTWDILTNSFSLPIGSYEFVIYDTRSEKYKLAFYWKDESWNNPSRYQSLEKLKSRLGDKLVFATNGGMYNPSYSPKGLFVDDNGIVKIELDTFKTDLTGGNFYLQPNGVFAINQNGKPQILSTTLFKQLHPYATNKNVRLTGINYATQSGPMLVIEGDINNAFGIYSKNTRLRSGVGVIDENHIVFVISKNKVNFLDFAILFKEIFQCKNALFLDGEVSRMYIQRHRNQLGGNFGAIIGISRTY